MLEGCLKDLNGDRFKFKKFQEEKINNMSLLIIKQKH